MSEAKKTIKALSSTAQHFAKGRRKISLIKKTNLAYTRTNDISQKGGRKIRRARNDVSLHTTLRRRGAQNRMQRVQFTHTLLRERKSRNAILNRVHFTLTTWTALCKTKPRNWIQRVYFTHTILQSIYSPTNICSSCRGDGGMKR